MPTSNEFLRELDRWVLVMLHEKIAEPVAEVAPADLGATQLSRMISDYVLLRIADDPGTCWTACDIDGAPDDAIAAATTFTEDAIAAAFIGAACELNHWENSTGVEFMVSHGVPVEDARDVATAIGVVSENLNRRGQRIIQRLGAHPPQPEPVPSAPHAIAS